MSSKPANRTVTVVNPQGLHARPADMVVRLANQFSASISIAKDGESVDCKSILSLLTLGAAAGTKLTLTADGDDADDALAALGHLFDSGFSDGSQPTARQPVDGRSDDGPANPGRHQGQVRDAKSAVDS